MFYSREAEILRHLADKSSLSVQQLSELLKVSEATVRRDLTSMEEKGLIIRKRGMALLPGTGAELILHPKDAVNRDLKRRIAQYAVSQISEGEVVALDPGTTTGELAKELLKKQNVTIFTYSLQIASILSRSNNQVYVVGGSLSKNDMAMVGSIAVDTVKQFNFNRYFMSLAGLCPTQGPSDDVLEEVEIKRALIQSSQHVVAMVDYTKFEKTSLVQVCDWDDIHEIITNKTPDRDLASELVHFHGKLTQV